MFTKNKKISKADIFYLHSFGIQCNYDIVSLKKKKIPFCDIPNNIIISGDTCKYHEIKRLTGIYHWALHNFILIF